MNRWAEAEPFGRLVTEHLRDGRIVEEFVFHRNTLGPGCVPLQARTER